LSTLVYQGYAGGGDVALLRKAGTIATGGLVPDWTGILDLAPAAAAARRREPADRIESRSGTFHEKVRQGFLAEASLDPDRISVIAAHEDAEAVHEQIVHEVRRVLDSLDRA
jgi:dTMP kinase